MQDDLMICRLPLSAVLLGLCITATASEVADQFATQRRDEVTSMAEVNEVFLKSSTEKKFMTAVTASVRDALKDPSSAQFRGTRIVRTPAGRVVCGEVNAKNAYGGYIGFQPYVAGAASVQLWENDRQYQDVTDAANAGIGETCAR